MFSIKKERNYGIELLRIILIFMVCILHVLGQGGGLVNVIPNTLKYNVFWGLEIFAYCAVDAFAIISGYTASNKPRKYERIVDIWFQVLFYSLIVTLFFIAINVISFNDIDIIKCLLPISFNKFWYITAYFALFFVIPIINKFIFSIDDKTAKKMFIIIFFLYSIIGLVSDSFQTIGGYSAIWLMVLYCIGVLAKKINLFKDKNILFLIVLWFISLLSTWILKVFFNNGLLVNYISPTILLNGIIMVIIFSRFNIKGRIVSKIAPLTLGIYLFQLNEVIWSKYIKDAFVFITDNRTILGVLYIVLFALLIFICGLIIEWIRQLLVKLFRLPKLYSKIVSIINNILNKIIRVLK